MNDVTSANAAEHRPALGRDGSTLTPRHVYLVDGSGFIFRAYHALPPLTRSDGTPTSGGRWRYRVRTGLRVKAWSAVTAARLVAPTDKPSASLAPSAICPIPVFNGTHPTRPASRPTQLCELVTGYFRRPRSCASRR